MQNAILLACGLLLVGVIARARIAVLGKLYLPAAVIAGVLGLILVQAVSLDGDGEASWITSIVAEWTRWRSALVPVIFAGLLLESTGGKWADDTRATAQQAMAAWILILGQIALGLAVTAFVLSPAFGVSIHFGQLLEVSWAGGFGSSAAWGQQHERIGAFANSRDFAVFCTTIGLLWGVLSGIVVVNIGIRKRFPATKPQPSVRAIDESRPIGVARISADLIDPLLFQGIFLAVAFATGWGLQQLIAAGSRQLDSQNVVRVATGELPLFLFTLIGGWIVRRAMVALRAGHLIDSTTLNRITGVALELLIFTAIATLAVRTLASHLIPIAILLAIGAAWCLFNVFVISPRILPRRCWFELAVLNYGFATATTPQGMMLLRMIDRDLKTDAAKIYAMAAPLSAMFVGGGVITFLVPLMLQRGGAIWVILACAAAIVLLYAMARQSNRSIDFGASVRSE